MSCRRTAVGGAAERRRVCVPSEHSRVRACTAAGSSRQRARSEGSDPQGATGRFSAAAGSLLRDFPTTAPLARRPIESAPAPALQIPKSEALSALVLREFERKHLTPARENFDRPLSGLPAFALSPPSPPARHHSTDISFRQMGSAAQQLRLLVLFTCRNRTGFKTIKKFLLTGGGGDDRF